MHFNSSDFGSDAPTPPPALPKPRPQRRRAVLGTMLAAVIAFILIAIVLAVISELGERRLALLQSPSIAVIAPPHSVRATPGLLAPPPLPTDRLLPPSPGSPEPAGPVRNLAAAPPPDLAPIPAPQAAAAPPPVLIPPPPPTPRQVLQVLASLPFTRIHDALLWRPYTDPSPKLLQRPAAGEELVQLREASRLSPEAVRAIAEERRPLETLAQMRAQAAMNRPPSATTRPSS